MNKTYPGINPLVNLNHFDADEFRIINKLAAEFYVTSSGDILKLGVNSQYKYILIKPTELYVEMFNLELEIIVIFSNYDTFEPRTLDTIDLVIKRYQSLRIEKLCSIIISKDTNIVKTVQDLVNADQESQIIIPFSYNEIINNNNNFLYRNRFKEHFFTRDLFAFEAPLKKDLYFFGRNDLIMKLVSRHKSYENSALFGLRKTGKTSVIFGMKRALETTENKLIFIDCQNPSFHMRTWNKALFFIMLEIKNQTNSTRELTPEEKYTEENASLLFEKDLTRIYKDIGEKSILLVFDEIENITFGTSPSKHWTINLDFIFLWQTIRTIFQKTNKMFSYLIVGTNPKCIETSSLQEKDNPIFNQVYFEYIPNFDVPQTREMVRKLGRIMGLQFDEIIYSKLTEDFGGHPFLIRHLGSIINNISPKERPVRVDKTLYEKAKKIFSTEYSHYIEMILGVLKQFYPDEFDMLKYLALGDINSFTELAKGAPEFTNHLIGYKIIDDNDGSYSFKIEAVKDYIANVHKYEKKLTTVHDMYKEISERRNYLEPKLRKIVRTQLLSKYGKSDATEYFLNILGEPRKSKYRGLAFNELFNANEVEIYFEDLRKTISKYYDELFRNILGINKEDVNDKLISINKYRSDTHAKDINLDELSIFRMSISYIEKRVDEFLE